jgi:hypothetical protein
LENFEIHVTGDPSIIQNARDLGLKTICVRLLRPNRTLLRREFMTSHRCRFADFDLCKKFVDRTVELLEEAGTEIYRIKIESPYYERYVKQSLYIETHFKPDENSPDIAKYPLSRNQIRIPPLATDREYDQASYRKFMDFWKDKEFELCLYDSNKYLDHDWMSLYY